MKKRLFLFSSQFILSFIFFLALYPNQSKAAVSTPETEINNVLNDFHRAAAKADFQNYFAQFAPNAVFIGTDASEHWTVEEFKTYAAPTFAKGKGWTYTSRERHVYFTDDKNPTFAWFDEILDSASYGTSRGSGVLVKIAQQWKIAQYNLSFPLPNDMAKKVTDEIKVYETNLKIKKEGKK